eukprot:CAMPEP_0117581358 /NCGR_PEP_ID=MMETSP0784-20121206/65776_1 /TAXON_ID=39447 /ORGANISM="" /LENGTH=78 /DNA_ID=CAMNT_0005381647 /DNA_START=173 /DNA_END=409 /DNA_ORIENTATION=+
MVSAAEMVTKEAFVEENAAQRRQIVGNERGLQSAVAPIDLQDLAGNEEVGLCCTLPNVNEQTLWKTRGRIESQDVARD